MRAVVRGCACVRARVCMCMCARARYLFGVWDFFSWGVGGGGGEEERWSASTRTKSVPRQAHKIRKVCARLASTPQWVPGTF